MDDTVEIRLGPLAAVRWVGWAFLFSTVGLGFMSADLAMPEDVPIGLGLGWVLLACGGLFAALAVRTYCWIRAHKVILTLTSDGIRGRPTQDVLVPWNRVISVRRDTRRPSTFALATQSFWLSYIVSTNDPFRYDVYNVTLDGDLTKKGVQGEHALGLGFDIIPALMSFSSARVAHAFSRWLPAERCIDFENRADPLTPQEFRDRLMETGTALALRLDSPVTPLSSAIVAETTASDIVADGQQPASGNDTATPSQSEDDTSTADPGSDDGGTDDGGSDESSSDD
ncbi:hypothetical protein [Paramagnetospirillum magneticum]|uniref:Uncharacterized protein n=1 Tax=Paramagnetospirillum magneticum (strain ATCC 700264 / AMB-1) TaxID=342108 RepID=Q2W265_PARM1|nr:hypothetical protein [Paramagnetospirillum magneticum]BAE52060.1 hypothetical protein amb3256 [Paramagnetospirillum magneticum AMB-1]